MSTVTVLAFTSPSLLTSPHHRYRCLPLPSSHSQSRSHSQSLLWSTASKLTHNHTIIIPIGIHIPILVTISVTVTILVAIFVKPPFQGCALRLMSHFPIERLARPRAVVHHPTNRTPPKLVPPCLGSAAPDMWTQSETWTRYPAPSCEPLRKKLTCRVRFGRRNVAAKIAEQRAASGAARNRPKLGHLLNTISRTKFQ